MSETRWLVWSERWSRMLLRLYPAHFREEMGGAVVETYRDRARAALRQGGVGSLMVVWMRALSDSLRNGVGERLRPSISWRRLGNWGRDSELVVRRLARAPLFVATMVGTLAVGLGAFAVVYALVDEVLFEPLPYENPDDLYTVWREYGWFELDKGSLAGTDLVELASAGGVIEGAVPIDGQRLTLSGGGRGEPQEVGAVSTTPGLFDLLGVRPVLGRGFAPGEVGSGRPGVVVLSHALWTTRFGADPGVVDTDIRLNGEPHTVVGVMGPEFRFEETTDVVSAGGAELFVTLDHELAEQNPNAGSYAGLIRARRGASPEAVASAVAAVGRRIDERDFEGQGLHLYPIGMKDDLIADVRPALVVLGVAGLLLVVVLGVNLATLLLVRAAQREREFAISRALGADRVALIRAMVLEGGILGAIGGAAGAAVAVWGTRAIVALAPLDLPRRDSIGVDASVALVVIGIGAALGLLAGALPAAWATRARLATVLRATSVRGGGGHGTMRRGLVVVQVALALVLLSSGGLVVRSFAQLLRADPGFEPSGVLTFRIPMTGERYESDEVVGAAQQRLHAALAVLPGVGAVSATSDLPLTADPTSVDAAFPSAPGNTGVEEHDEPLVDRIVARPGYFETLGIPILAGRGFGRDAVEGPPEAIIDRTLAAEFFPTGNPIGATMLLFGDSVTVVGVAEHARLYDLYRDDRPQVFIRADQYVESGLSWAIRTDRSPLSLVSEARAAIWRVDPELAVSNVRTMDQIVAGSVRQQRVSAVLIAGFSVGALLLAAMGLYGVVAGSVSRRRHEIAVRMAIGAERGQVLRLVVRDGMILVLIGLLIGIPGIYLSSRVIDGILVGISPFDPLTLGGVALTLMLVALAACYLPARRVSGIEPAGLLRQE